MPANSLFSRAAIVIACALSCGTGALAQQTPTPPVSNSSLDASLFYQLLLGEMTARGGEAGTAYQVILDAARKTRDESLFQRAVEIALQARSGEDALAAAQAWRKSLPDSLDAVRFQVQLLIALNRQADSVEPIRTLVRLTPMPDRQATIATLPRLFMHAGGDKQKAAQLLDQALEPSLSIDENRAVALMAQGQGWFNAGDTARALDLDRQAHAQDKTAEAPALLALELMASTPAAESIVMSHLQAKPSSASIRLLYARVLASTQRYADALPQLEAVTRVPNSTAAAWLTLGALHIELKHPREANAVLTQFLAKLDSGAIATSVADEDDDDDPATPDQNRVQAYLLLSQSAEQLRDFKGAEAWLAKITNSTRQIDVQARRASLLAKQGKVKEARELIRRAPETGPEDVRSKLVTEAQLLRDVKQWAAANEVLAQANEKFPNDPDLLYEQSMMAEKLDRLDEMERLLRKVIELKPDHQHAYNALGYSLAERNIRLPEARDLIKKALILAPGEPFITDSLGWVEYRLGNRDEALKLLQQAYKSRPDVEIGTHLGEVLWVSGQRDEARRVLREARGRDSSNDVLKETLARLKVDL